MIINTICEYVKIVTELNKGRECNGANKNEVLLFRGQADENYALLPSIARNRKCAADISIFNEERNLIEMAKFKLPNIFNQNMEPLDLLCLLQHHGIPTRLLDITENALVALYFACCSEKKANGEIIVFKHNELDISNAPIVNAIADSYRFADTTFSNLSSFYASAKNQPYFIEQKHSVEFLFESEEAGGEWVDECCSKPFFLYAPARTTRQKAQQGRYILFNNEIKTYENDKHKFFTTRILAMPKDHPCIVERLVIPKERKEQFIKDLEILGIKREVLFGDNVDIVCEEIKKTFVNKIRCEDC